MALGSCLQDEHTWRHCIHMTLTSKSKVLHERINLLLFLSLLFYRYKFVLMVAEFHYPPTSAYNLRKRLKSCVDNSFVFCSNELGVK